MFQSLKGFGVDFDQGGILQARQLLKFQSLKGFGVDFDGGTLKALIYRVFKVQMRG
jgi:hypothetical protein